MLVAPLNWGLGHATRCIPIINALLKYGYTPVIASDGAALKLLQLEFPKLQCYHLPTYNIKYAKKGYYLPLKIALQFPHIYKTAILEKKEIAKIIKKEKIMGIISDNRFGVFHPKIKSVYITHQINIKAVFFSYISSKIHQKIIKKHNECWIPDTPSKSNFSGALSTAKSDLSKTKFIGILSRFKPRKIQKKYKLLVLLSGPEPQRTLLEKKLLKELKNFKGNVLFVRGVLNANKINNTTNIEFENYLLSSALETAILQSEIIITRSGFTTIMDLAVLKSKAFFIPTPGQTEQFYLAERLHKMKIAPYCKQRHFKITDLDSVKNYKGLNGSNALLEQSMFKLF